MLACGFATGAVGSRGCWVRGGLILLKHQDFIARADCLGLVTVGRRDDWGVGDRLDKRHGVTTAADGRVVRLNHSSNGLSGEIPRRSETSPRSRSLPSPATN